ncbi:hypothetical protein HPB51_000147 [Rhipicephalus microplus]|uniref:Uncharacterized protein n=1 Tax=Rhipicephalus microplus TaxID=6941 RepID=A0A9J6DDY5_RHIMP|nr:hypothetical protein HPB51_000147 [Rhipicephalus microplus]
MEVLLVCGWLPPSEGHARRISKILRSESRRQVRHFKDCLRVACSSVSDGRLNVKVFREWCRQANILTEAMWNDVRRGLPRKKRDPPKGGLLLLGDAVVEERQQKVLRLGPKFCVEPRLDLVDKLSLTRDIARQVPEKEKDRCVVECVDVVAKASVSRLQDEGYPFSVMLAVGTRARKLSWFLKNAQCPMEVLLVCGWLPPSEGHARRISKILRSESRRQVRHFKDCLRVACSSVSDGRLNVKVFREWCRQANILTEAMWNDVRRGLPRKKRDPPKGGLLLLGDAVVEERQQKVLRLGPKFCVEPRLDLVDKLSLTRDIARQVPEKEKDRCVVECVDVVAKASFGFSSYCSSVKPPKLGGEFSKAQWAGGWPGQQRLGDESEAAAGDEATTVGCPGSCKQRLGRKPTIIGCRRSLLRGAAATVLQIYEHVCEVSFLTFIEANKLRQPRLDETLSFFRHLLT